MTREFLDSVDDMLDAIQKARSFCAGMTFKSFAKDDKTVYAVIHAFPFASRISRLASSVSPLTSRPLFPIRNSPFTIIL